MQNSPPADSNDARVRGPYEAATHEGGGRPVRVGDPVRLRRQRWRVAARRQYDGCSVLTLTGIGVQNGGAERRVIVPFDIVEPLERPPRLRIVRMRHWRLRCRALLAEHGPASMLRTALPARIDLLPHQLEPALAVVCGLGSRLLIADEVGLGKTIQAGLIVTELVARGAADRVLVLAPAGLREQWACELHERFGVAATLIDMREARRRASDLPVGVNPWSTVPVAIASLDYVKRPEVLPAVLCCRWDVVIVDEAHGVAPGSERYDAVAALCALSPHVLLLTATPHSGDHPAFASLCGLGRHAGDRLLVFRRRRDDVALGAVRRIHRLHIRPSADEMRMHAMLARFARAVRAERGDRDREVWLTLAILHKRALSSARSLEQSVRRRLAIPAVQSAKRSQQLGLPLGEVGELDPSDEAPSWTVPVMDDVEHERRLLEAIAGAAAVAARGETKLRALARLLARMQRRGEHVIVFTEYRDTLLHLRDSLPFACAVLHGGLTRDERRSALEHFTNGRQPILLTTDAAGEGLNLHQNCRVVINLELPWNPVRLEQRAGRVDRIGQRRSVHAFHLIARDTSETCILERLKGRIARARQVIDAADPLGLFSVDEEEIVSHLVIDGDTGPTGSLIADAPCRPVQDESLRIVRLTEEAALEHARLLRARAVLVPRHHRTQPPLVEEQAVTLARRPDIRSVLASHLLVIVRSIFEDFAGRVVASHVTPLLIRVTPRIRRQGFAGAVTTLLRALQPLAIGTLDPSYTAWHSDTSRHHRSFWETRLARERAIAGTRGTQETPGLQPGLFDRRAERERQARDGRHREMADDAMRHLSAAERAALIVAKDPGVVLILVP